jgi:Zn ribbon nucleic-acid-binding protein
MAQTFHRSTNTISRVSIFGAVFVAAIGVFLLLEFNRSAYMTQTGIPREQSVPFSHKHHVNGLGIDCRYCHTSVEEADFAGIPPTHTCMTCHSQIWKDSPMLQPVRESYRTGQPLEWTRVHDLPGFVYFNHSIHVHQGVGCVTCHGQVDQMPLVWKENSLNMEWCLECHRQPERFVRPREHVFNLHWQPEENQLALGRRLVSEYGIDRPTDCYVCHR